MGRTGILLDRDGTIIRDHGYVGSVDRVDFIPGSVEAIGAFNRAGIPVAVVTNQAGVARGLYGVEDVVRLHQHLAEHLAVQGAHVDLFLFCPYHPAGTVEPFARWSADRKPGPGMALAAADALDLDLASSWVVGDRDEDMGLAAAVGATGICIAPGPSDEAALRFPDLAAAARFILGHGSPPRGRSRSSPTMTVKFPPQRFDSGPSYFQAYFAESGKAAASIDLSQMDRAADMLVAAHERGAAVFSCGNGGSASIANHFQCDHLKGVRNGTGLRTRVLSLSNNMELVTAIANDGSYDDIFRYQLESQARAGDVLLAISSSGGSSNIVKAIRWARETGLQIIALTGFSGGEARTLADVSIHVESVNYGVVEDSHQAIMHALAQYIRQSLMSPDDVATSIF